MPPYVPQIQIHNVLNISMETELAAMEKIICGEVH